MSETSLGGWARVHLQDVCEILDKCRVPVNAKSRALRRGQVPYYGATGLVDRIDEALFDEDLVLLGEDGAPFLDPAKPKAYFVSGPSWVNNHAHVLRTVGGVAPRYLMHQLNTVDYHPFVTGTTRLKLSQAPMRKIPLVIAPLAEQLRIVAAIEEHLSRLDASVAALLRTDRMITSYRAAVLQAACMGRLVEHDSLVAVREGRRFEQANSLVGRLQRLNGDVGAAQRRALSETDDAVRPPLPLGWSWEPLGKLGFIQGGIQKQPSRLPRTNKYPFLRVANVGRGTLDLSEVHEIELFGGELERLKLVTGDLLIVEGNGSRSEIGRLAEWDGSIPNCVHQNHLIRFRALPGISAKYVATYWNSVGGSARVLSVASSTSGLYTLSVGKVARVAIPVPPSAEQRRIVEEVDRQLSLAASMASSVRGALARATRLRQSILKRAFEGKLVRQDPRDEPASVLLDRIRASRATPAAKPRRGRRSA